jgi:DNA-binding CsgD family transcriptional regulator/transcriptional regulator of acetoin/glycerol metabolism
LAPPFVGEIDERSILVRVSTPVVAGLAEDLACTDTSVVVADVEGCVALRRVPNRREERRLDGVMLGPGYHWAFEHTGTNGLSDTLVTGRASLADGAEHFFDALCRITTAGAPVRDPRTAQVIGVLGLVCDAAATNSLLLPMARRVARDIELSMLGGQFPHDKRLEEAFLAARRRTRGPLALVSQGALLTNTAGARFFDAAEQPRLWDFARRHLWSTRRAQSEFLVSHGRPLRVSLEAVSDGNNVAGVLIRALDPSRAGDHSRDRPVRLCRQTFGWESLTEAEQTVTTLVSDGLTNRQVASKLWLSRHTVDAHLRHIYQKLDIHSRLELVRIATSRTSTAATPDAVAVA